MTRRAVALYPRKSSARNPFLKNLSLAFENQDVEVLHWLASNLLRKKPQALILNWAENHWDETQSCGGPLMIKRLKRALVVSSLRYHRAQNTHIILFAHNFFPHGNGQDFDFWRQSGSQLAHMIDDVVHFSNTSVNFFQPLLNNAKHHLVTPFPIFQDEEPHRKDNETKPIVRLLLVGSNQARKNLLPLLRKEYEALNLPTYVTGYKNRKQCARKTGVSASSINQHVRWLGTRISHNALETLLTPGTAVVINQTSQLNSSLLWQAVSRGVPVIAPKSRINQEIQAEVGSELVRLFSRPLTPQSLGRLVTSQPKASTPDLTEHTYANLVEIISERLNHV